MQILISLTTFHPECIFTQLSGNDQKWIKDGFKKYAVSIDSLKKRITFNPVVFYPRPSGKAALDG